MFLSIDLNNENQLANKKQEFKLNTQTPATAINKIYLFNY